MSDVKVFVAIPKKKDLPPQEFHDHWRHPHATWGLEVARRTHYVQSHQVDSTHLGDQQGRFSGIAEIWFPTVADAMGFNADPVYKTKLAPDEPNFADIRNVRFLVADEEILMGGPSKEVGSREEDMGWIEAERPVSIKCIQIFAPDDRTWAQTDDLKDGHLIGALRHVRCKPNPVVHEKGAFASGIRELWWPTLTAFERGVQGTPEIWRKLTGRAGSNVLLAIAERFV